MGRNDRPADKRDRKKSGEPKVAKIVKPRAKIISKVTNTHRKIVREAWEDILENQYQEYLRSEKIPSESSEEVLLKAKCDLILLSKDTLVKRLRHGFDKCENLKPIKHLFVDGHYVTKLVDQDVKKTTSNYEKLKRANAKAQHSDPLSHLTYKGQRICKKHITSLASQAALDERQRKEDEAETLRLAMIATDEALINEGKALLNEINGIISVAKTNTILKIAPKHQASAIKSFVKFEHVKNKLFHLPMLEKEGRELVLLLSTAVKNMRQIGSSVEWPSVTTGPRIFTTVGINPQTSSAATKKSNIGKKSPGTMTSDGVHRAISRNMNESVPGLISRTMELCDTKMATYALKKPSNELMPNGYVQVSPDQKDQAITTLANYFKQLRREEIENANSTCKLTHAATYVFSYVPPHLRLDVDDNEPPRKIAFGQGSSSEVASVCSQILGAFHHGAVETSQVAKRRLNTTGIRNNGNNFVYFNIEPGPTPPAQGPMLPVPANNDVQVEPQRKRSRKK